MSSLANAEPTTRPSLLIRLRDCQDHEAWRIFNRLYGPLIFEFCRNRGLQESDAAEVMQETLLQISKSIQTLEYNSSRGRFRGWVGTILRSKLVEFFRRQKRAVPIQPAALDLIAGPDDAVWYDVWLEHIVLAALNRIQSRLSDRTWTAFEAVWLNHRDPAEVARELGRSVAWVYLAKSRGLSLLRQEVSFFADEPLSCFESKSEADHAVSKITRQHS